MRQLRRLAALLAVALFLSAVGDASAERVPSPRSSGQKSTGARQDSSVPYLTTGNSAFMATGKVAPRIYASPTVDDPKNPQAKPVYNLIFYGAAQSFGDRSNGATPKPK